MKKIALLMAALSWPLLHWQTIQCAYAYPDIGAMDLNDENPDQQEALGRIYDLLDRIEGTLKPINVYEIKNIKTIRTLLATGPDAVDEWGTTDLLLAFYSENMSNPLWLSLQKELINYHSLIQDRDNFARYINTRTHDERHTALSFACYRKKMDLFEMLLQYGANPDIPLNNRVRGKHTLRQFLQHYSNQPDYHSFFPYLNLINQYAPEQPYMDIE